MKNLGKILLKIPLVIPFAKEEGKRNPVERIKAGQAAGEEDSSSDKSPAISRRVSFSEEHRPTRFHRGPVHVSHRYLVSAHKGIAQVYERG